jgi:hypothetical protein
MSWPDCDWASAAHRAVVGLAERFRLLAELVVRGRDEVVPAEERQLSLLSVGGRLVQREPGSHPGRATGGGTEEAATVDPAGSSLIHEGPPIGREVSGQLREP